MLILSIFALGGAVLLWVGSPFWRRREEAETAPDQTALQDLLFQKEALLAAARELDFDLQTDKLSPEDHRELRDRCQAKAVAVMERLETLASPKRAPARRAGGAAEGRWAHPGAERPAGGRPRFCARCGRRSRPPYRYCTGCGARLEAEGER